jgi:hypothetical protein
VHVHADAAIVEARPEGLRVAGGPILRLAAWETTRVERHRPARSGS